MITPDSLTITPELPTLDADHIALLVDRFYDNVRLDPLIGPVFDDVVTDWATHKRTMTSFWCSVALRAGTYRGNPMRKHKPLPVGTEHFDRWLEIWDTTTGEVMDVHAATVMRSYAQRIGRGLQLGIGLGKHTHDASHGEPCDGDCAGACNC